MNEEVVLKMLVEMGVINAGQIDDLRAKLDGLKTTSDDAASSTKELTEADTAYIPASMQAGDAIDSQGKSAAGSSLHHRELRLALNELNRIIPGLGHVVYMLENGMRAEAAATDTATAANESFIESAGPIAILLLGIQALITVWDYYKSKAKAAEEANTEMFKKLDEDAHKALASVEALNKALHPDESATKKYSDEIERRNATLSEQERVEAEERKIQQDAALAAAKTPQEKAAIKARNEQEDKTVKEQSVDDHAGIEVEVSQKIQAEIDSRTKTAADNAKLLALDLHQEIATNFDPNAVAKLNKDTDSNNENNNQIEALTKQLNELNQKLGTAAAVRKIGMTGDAAIAAEKTSVGDVAGAEKLSDAAASGENLSKDQQQFILRVAQAGSGMALNLKQAETYLTFLESHPAAMTDALSKLGTAISNRDSSFQRQINDLAARIQSHH